MVSEEQNSGMELVSEIVPIPQIQPEVETAEDINATNDEVNNISCGKKRYRKNALFAAILKQMEFYFGDANLSKDRFLAELIKQDPNVDLEVFLRFNKIRTLTSDVKRIAKALRKSTILNVSEDGTKVSRITPIAERQNVDDCTVYVQRLPFDADHEWLTTLFSEYGPVAYISIPKFKFNHKIKGFAFVEFESPDAAQKCLTAFRAKGCELPCHTSPTDVLSITTFSEEGKMEQNGEKTNSNNEPVVEVSSESEKSKLKMKKKKSLKQDDFDDSETDHSVHIKVKKIKQNDNDEKDSSASISDSSTQEKHSKKRKYKSLTEVSGSDDDIKQKKMKVESDEDNQSEVKVKDETDEIDKCEEVKNCLTENGTSEKKKKNKRKNKRKQNHSSHDILKTADMGLQVMGKKDWKKLRNKYLGLQRSKMKQLKEHVRKARWNQWGDRNRMDVECKDIDSSKKEKSSTNSIEFVPGIIVKIELNEACVDPKGFKAELRSNNNIKYIDIKEGSTIAYVRCDSSESAISITDNTNNERHYQILAGEEEKAYWDKITKDREEKIGNKVRVKQRGRDKLLKKAEKELGKHIRFDEG